MRQPSWSRVVLTSFVASIVINALLGIWALLSGDFGSTDAKIVGTSFLVSASMLSVLVNAPAIGRRAAWPAPPVAATTGAAGFALLIVLVWAEHFGEHWWKVTGSLLVVAAAGTLIANLSLVELPHGLERLRSVAIAMISLTAITVLVGIWTEPDVEWYARLLGIEAVLVAATTLLVPALSRFGPGRRPAGRADLSAEPIVRFCPACGTSISEAGDGPQPVTCAACGLTFDVTFDAGTSGRRHDVGAT